LDEARKDAQWLLALGAAGVLGVVIKDGFGETTPILRVVTLAVSIVQIGISMTGALSWWSGEIDKSVIIESLTHRLRTRLFLRNLSVVLLAVSFVLIAILGWHTVACKK
jgi:hypothetical protein